MTDFNNIRVRTTIGQYKNIQPLIEEIHYTNEGRYNELATELIQKNMRESVIVFTDKDEKIGEWEFVNLMRNEENPFPLCKCTFQDGTELPFTLYMLPVSYTHLPHFNINDSRPLSKNSINI